MLAPRPRLDAGARNVGGLKRLLARTLYQARAGASGYFEADIAALSREDLGLEVFGSERGTVLAVDHVHLPPLRERGGDITVLARHEIREGVS